MIPALRISVSQKEEIIQNITKILDSKIKWTNSDFCNEVENLFSTLSQNKYNITLSTGSSAITALLYALNIMNSIIFVPVLTAPATIISCLNSNSKLVCVDANSSSFAMSPLDLEKKIQKYYLGKTYKNGAIIMVHVGGVISKEVLEIRAIAEKYGLFFIEDCAHAHGSYYDGKSAGTFGIAGTFSFFLTKTITCGEGGIVTTNSPDINEKVRKIRNYGKANNGLITERGSSWRLNEFSAAVLISQIKHFCDTGNKRRQWIAKQYNDNINNNYFKIFNLPAKSKSGYYKYILKVNKPDTFSYIDFFNYMRNHDIMLPARVFDRLTIEEPFIHSCTQIINISDNFDVARHLCNEHVCLPIYEDLTDIEVEKIINTINGYPEKP